jgi:hypothetical protein
VYTELGTGKASRRIMWWKMGVCRLKGVRRNSQKQICPICSKGEDSSHVLGSESTEIWKAVILDNRFRNMNY